jgi:hypothetical protein
MALRLGQQRNLRNQAEGAAKVVEPELAGQGAVAVALPVRDLGGQPGDLCLRERRRPRRILLAVLVEKLGNGRTVPVKRRVGDASRLSGR